MEAKTRKIKTKKIKRNRIGDHKWYISDTSKFKKHYPKWKQTYNVKKIINEISKIVKKEKITKIIGIDARGFIFGSIVSNNNNIPFVPIRKKGKLPGAVYKKKYKLEYGYDQVELQKNSLLKKDKVLIVDDLIATGGTAIAAHTQSTPTP